MFFDKLIISRCFVDVCDALTFRLERMRTEGYTYSSSVTSSGVEKRYEYNSGTCKQDFAYTYDKAGNILNINNTITATPRIPSRGIEK